MDVSLTSSPIDLMSRQEELAGTTRVCKLHNCCVGTKAQSFLSRQATDLHGSKLLAAAVAQAVVREMHVWL